MERVCFLGRVRPDRLAEYRERHGAVWPEMLDALRQAGWSNYSLFLAALDRMARAVINGRWQAEMAEFFTDLDGLPPDQGFRRVAEVFHLD